MVSVWGWDTRASQAITWDSSPQVTHGDVLSQLKCDGLFSYTSLPLKEVVSPRPHQPRRGRGPQPTMSQKLSPTRSALWASNSSGLATEGGRDRAPARVSARGPAGRGLRCPPLSPRPSRSHVQAAAGRDTGTPLHLKSKFHRCSRGPPARFLPASHQTF